MKNPFLFILLISFTCVGQDDSVKTRLRVSTIGLFTGITTYGDEVVTYDYAMSFSKRADVKAESNGYKHYNDFGGRSKPFGFELGINAGFKITGSNSGFLKRLEPRFSLLYYRVRYIQDYRMSYSNVVIKDTLPPTSQNPMPVYVDSTTYGDINYYYTSNQVLVETGANINLIVKHAFTFYTGILFGYGLSYKNEMLVSKYEWGYLHNYSNAKSATQRVEVADYVHRYREQPSSSKRVTVALGAKFRFNKEKTRSLGLCLELQPGVENYHISGGIGFTKFFCPVKIGLQYCFMPNG